MSASERDAIRREIEALPGVKEDDFAPCGFCGGDLGLVFYRVRIEQAAMDTQAFKRRVGLGMMMGGHQQIARAFSPDEDLAKILQQGTCLVCGDCAAKMPILALLEVAEEST